MNLEMIFNLLSPAYGKFREKYNLRECELLKTFSPEQYFLAVKYVRHELGSPRTSAREICVHLYEECGQPVLAFTEMKVKKEKQGEKEDRGQKRKERFQRTGGA